MNRIMPPAHELVLNVVIGAVTGGLASGLIWLITGQPPVWWVSVLGSYALLLAATGVYRIHRRSEQARLQAAFDQPAYGDTNPGEGR